MAATGEAQQTQTPGAEHFHMSNRVIEEKLDAIAEALARLEQILLTVPKAAQTTRDAVAELRREMRARHAELMVAIVRRHTPSHKEDQ